MKISYSWIEFGEKPYKLSKSLKQPISKKPLLSALRLNIGHITSMKVVAIGEKMERTKYGTSYFVKKKRGRAPSQIKDLILLLTENNGDLRIFSLFTYEYISIFQYSFGGLNSVELNYDHSLMAISTQDDSFIVLNLEKQCAMKISIHSNFVTFAGFFKHLNDVLDCKIRYKKEGICDSVTRVIACSLDKNISVLDFTNTYFDEIKPKKNEKITLLETYDVNLKNLHKETFKEVKGSINVYILDSLITKEFREPTIIENKVFLKKIKNITSNYKHGYSSAKIVSDTLLTYSLDSVGEIYQFQTSNKTKMLTMSEGSSLEDRANAKQRC